MNGEGMNYQLAVSPNVDQPIVLEYHGAEIQPNRFTILVDGCQVASETNLKNFALPVLYGKAYRLQASSIGMKTAVTVKLQADWKYDTARLFSIRSVPRIS